MPVILSKGDFEPWLSGPAAASAARLGFELWDDLIARSLTERPVVPGEGIAISYYQNPDTWKKAFTTVAGTMTTLTRSPPTNMPSTRSVFG